MIFIEKERDRIGGMWYGAWCFWYLSLYMRMEMIWSVFAFFLLETHKEKLKKSLSKSTKKQHIHCYVYFSFWFFLKFSLPFALWWKLVVSNAGHIYYITQILLLSLYCCCCCATLTVGQKSIDIYIYMYVCVSVCFWKGPNISLFGLGIAEKNTKHKLFFFSLGERDMPLDLFGLEILTILIIIIISLLSDVWYIYIFVHTQQHNFPPPYNLLGVLLIRSSEKSFLF